MTALLAVGSGWLAAAWTSPAPRPAPAEKPAAAITAGDDPVNVEIERIGKDPGTGGNAARLAALATRFREAPLSQLSELRSMLDSWRPGTEKEVARAVIDSRLAEEDAPAATPDTAAPDAEIAALAEDSGEDDDHLDAYLKWAAQDPAAAMEAVLKMPKGEPRFEAVNQIASVLAEDDPATAMEFLLKSGENHLSQGAAETCLALLGKDKAAVGKVLKRMNSQQQQNLATALRERVANGAGEEMEDGDIGVLGAAALGLQEGPGKQSLLLELFRQGFHFADAQPYLNGADRHAEFFPEKRPEDAAFAAAQFEKEVVHDPAGAVAALKEQPFLTQEGKASVITAAAPVVLPQLCRTGHVAEAVQLLNEVRDAAAWRKGFNAVLPYWMDSDPAAARAAFEAAPLTALEKERWRRNPAFLLNP